MTLDREQAREVLIDFLDESHGDVLPLDRWIDEFEKCSGPHSWADVERFIDDNYPVTTFPVLPDAPGRDSGTRILSLLRRVHELETRQEASRG